MSEVTHQTTPVAGGSKTLRTVVPGVLACLCLVALVVWKLKVSEPPLPVLSVVGDFTLTNQVGKAYGSQELKGKVWVANIVFTRCPGPCVQMSRRMAHLQGRFAQDDRVRLVSLTADPTYDTPAILSKYAAKFDADPLRWSFLTGAKSEIIRVAVDQLKLTAVEKELRERESPDDLFIHSTISVVVDRQGRLRMSVEALETNGPALLETTVRKLIRE